MHAFGFVPPPPLPHQQLATRLLHVSSTAGVASTRSESTVHGTMAAQDTSQHTAHRPHLEHARLPVRARGAVSAIVLQCRTEQRRAVEEATRVVSD
jgi:hypothetical protein